MVRSLGVKLCPPLRRRTLRCDETGARTNVVDDQRGSSMADGEGLVTRPAVHGTSADRQFTQHSTLSTSQLHQPSPLDDSYRDPSDGKGAVDRGDNDGGAVDVTVGAGWRRYGTHLRS